MDKKMPEEIRDAFMRDLTDDCIKGQADGCREKFLDECMEPPGGNTINSWVVRLMHRYGSLNFTQFQALGIHPGQIPVLSVLKRQEGVSQREIADMLHIKPPTVTVTLQRLEKSGFVCRKPDPRDQRISRIFLTEKGRSMDKTFEQLIFKNEEILTRGFSEEEKDLLGQMLQRMVNNLMEETTLW